MKMTREQQIDLIKTAAQRQLKLAERARENPDFNQHGYKVLKENQSFSVEKQCA
jgi:hypothetical protein